MLRFLVGLLLQPWLVLLVLTAAGLLNLWRRRVESRRRLWLVSAPLLLLVLVSMPAVSYFAFGSLEWPYPESYQRPAGAEAIVVLGGYVANPTETRPHANLGPDSVTRCLHAVKLYRQGSACPVVVTGGKMKPDEPGPSIAQAMGQFLRENGVADGDLILEAESRNTYENAVGVKRLLGPRGVRKIILVTDATHLRRAEACFRKQGFDVLPSGCVFHATKFDWELATFLPNAGTASDWQEVLHEWAGIAYYRLRGWL